MNPITSQIIHYFTSLEWGYILTFILISYGVNHPKATSLFFSIFKCKIPTRYRVLIVGVLYGISIYFLRGYNIHKIETLLQSFIFAMVFHKLLLEKLLTLIKDKL